MLEAVLTATIMVTAIAWVVTYQPSGLVSAERLVANAFETQITDFVNVRFELPQERALCRGASVGEQWLLDAASSRPNSFEDQVHLAFPLGVSANLMMKNGVGKMWLHKEFDNFALAGYGYPFEPNWSAAYLVPALGVASGAEQVEFNTAAIVKGDIQLPKGDALEIVVTFTDGHQERIYASTALIGQPWQERQFAQNLTLLITGSSTRALKQNIDVGQVSPVEKDPTTVRLMISPGPQGTSATASILPAGTTLTLRFPPQWSGFVFAPETLEKWGASTSSNAAIGIVAQLVLQQASATNETIWLDAFAPTLPTQPFDIITAELSNGSLGRSEFVVQYPAGADMGLPVTLHPSVPYPLRAGSSAILGVAVANGGANATIRHVDFLLPGGFDMRHNGGRGAELFAAGGAPEKVSGTGSGGAWSRVDGRHIRWTGTQAVAAGKAAEFLVSVNITSDLSQATGLEGAWTPRIATELEYDNAYTLTSTGWGQTPGFVRSLVKPDSLLTPEADGYPHAPQEPGQIVTYPVRAEVHMPMGKLTAESEYTLVSGTSELGRVRNAADNATMRVSERIAPMGSIVSVDHDVSSLLTTLADEGAGAITLKTELYTPASEACGPTRTWSRTASTLPLATIDDIELYDELGLGAPGVYLASRDGQAYKVGTLGATAWSRATQGVPTVVAAATMPVVGASVFVGTADGAVARVDPLLGGSVAWSVAMTTTGDPTGDPTIRGILPNATSGKLLVWSDKVIEILDPATGARVATRDYGVPVNTNTIRQVAWDADGAITFLDQHGLYRIDGALATLDGLFVEDAVGFALTPTSALLALPESVSILDRPTLSQAGDALPLAGAAKLAAAGDATGDGIDDLVVALDTLVVQVVSGATNTITATRTAALPDLGLGVGGIPAYGPRYVPDGDSVVLDQMTMDTMDCPETSITNAYDADQACFDTQDPNNRVPLPLRLDARDGYVLYSFRLSSVAKTVAWDADGDLVLAVQHAPGIMPTSQTMGAWTAGTDAFAVATSDGTLSLYAASTGALVWSAQPTSSTGTFAFHLRVPQGGFFGTHMLLTRIQWEDPAAGPQEAVLTDWFQVVGPDGTPVLTPYYTMVALLQADDRPLLAEP